MRIVVLSLVDPWAQSDGGTLRTRALMGSLVDLGHDVVAMCPGEGRPAQPVHVVRLPSAPLGGRRLPEGVRAFKRYLLPMPTAAGARSEAVLAGLRSVGPADLLLISQLSAAQYAAAVPTAGLWLDHSDLWSAFASRAALGHRGVGRITGLQQARRLADQEVRLSSAAAIVTAAGAGDAARLEQRLPRKVTWLPTPVDLAEPPAPRPTDRRRTAGFIGNFGFSPNVDAVQALLGSWGPQLRDRGWDIVVAGLRSEGLRLPSWVRCLGAVERPRDFYAEVDLALAPIRHGGGMKVKVVESLMHGRPVLASPFAMEGFPPELQAAVSIARVDLGPLPDDATLTSLPSGLAEMLTAFTHQGLRDRLRGLLPS